MKTDISYKELKPGDKIHVTFPGDEMADDIKGTVVNVGHETTNNIPTAVLIMLDDAIIYRPIDDETAVTILPPDNGRATIMIPVGTRYRIERN